MNMSLQSTHTCETDIYVNYEISTTGTLATWSKST
jgi:hypothetical protein